MRVEVVTALVLIATACQVSAEPAKQERAMPPADVYHQYLRAHGVNVTSATVTDEASIAIGGFRMLNVTSGGAEMRAAVSETGLVTGAKAPADAWWPFLAAGDAGALADRIAWLESSATRPVVVVRAAEPIPRLSVDAELWRRAPAPRLESTNEKRVLTCWLFAKDADAPTERVIVVHPTGPATITDRTASTVVALADPATRSVAALTNKDAAIVQWGLYVISRAHDTKATGAVAKVLAGGDARLRSAAASTLAELAVPGTVEPLATAATRETDEIARVAEVQALGAIATPASARALAGLRATMRGDAHADVIHALARIGSAAPEEVRAALMDAAAHDTDPALRALAAQYLQDL